MPPELILCVGVGAFAALLAAILTWVHVEARTIRRVRKKGLVAVMRPREPCVVMVGGVKIEATAYPLPDGGVVACANEGFDFATIPPDSNKLVLLKIFERDMPVFVRRTNKGDLLSIFL